MTQRRKPLTQLTLDEHLLAIQTIAEDALDQKKLAVALKAHELIGKALGFYVERHQHDVGPTTKIEALARIRALLETTPDIRALLDREATTLSPEQQHAVLASAGGIRRLQDNSAALSVAASQNGRQITDSGQYPPSSGENQSSSSYESSDGPENSASSESMASPDIQPYGSPSTRVS